jgi:uncharacterized membrane protein
MHGEHQNRDAGAPNASQADHHEHGAKTQDHSSGVPSTAAIAGHPLHPILVPFPIAFLVAALATDLAAWRTDDAFWARASLWLTGTGLATGALAALLGAIDFLTIERARMHRIGWIHAVGNSSALVLALVSWMLRLGDPDSAVLPGGIALSAIVASLLVVTGWAGGELAYRHLIGATGHGDHKQEPAKEDHGTIHEQKHEQATGADRHEQMDHAVTGALMSAAFQVTRPQLAAVTILTLLTLTVAVIWSASYANLRLSAKDVGGVVMPPGMIMTNDTPAEAMRDMAAVDPDAVRYTAPSDARGDQPLEPRIEDGVKVYDLEVSVIKWNILPDELVMAYAFNNQVPGPRIRVTEGDRIRINVTNHLPESTTVHWHGLVLPNAMDGPAEITQDPIEPGQTFTYEFTTQQRGTFFYHSHDNPDRQQALGLYGALIIDPKDPADYPYNYDYELVVQLQEWLEREGYTFPAMPMEGAMPNFFTINGKAFPETETITMTVGETLLVRFIGSQSGFIHPMHIHGGPFRIVETDGYPAPPEAQWTKDTVNVGPGERYDVLWEAREPGRWLLHCHINHHVTNNNVEEEGGGGLMLIIEVTPAPVAETST